MGEARRKKERKAPVKPTEKLDPIPTPTDRPLADKQKKFCHDLIEKVLADESALSFSKPVEDLWDVKLLGGYFEMIKKPMDLGTVLSRISSTYVQSQYPSLFDPNSFREEARLVFLNAIQYNGKSSDLGRFATKFIHFIDAQMAYLPLQPEDDDKVSKGEPSDANTRDGSTGDKPSDKEAEKERSSTAKDRSRDKAGKHSVDKDRGDSEERDIDARTLTDHDKVGGQDSPNQKDMDVRTDDGRNDNNTRDAEHGDKAGDDRKHGKKEKGKSKGDGNRAHDGGDFERDGENGKGDDKGEGADEGDLERAGRPSSDDANDEAEEDMGKESAADASEREKLEKQISKYSKLRARAQLNIAELELEKNSPLTFDENKRLRDEVESLPWETSQKVVDILRKYVDDALRVSNETDPEFVTFEFSTVEPKLLRQIEALIRPDARVTREKEVIDEADREMDAAKRRLKRLGESSHSQGRKKRAKKSR